MNRPFFSVVIPTKNRSFLVKSAIRSVLNQSFQDVEVVIADNDDTDQTQRAVEEIRDQRIRYFRTGGLSMPDNWDFAYGKAEGEYIMLLEDKQLLKTRALEKIYSIVERDRPAVVSWCYDQIRDDQTPVRVIKAGGTGKALYILSSQIIYDLLNYGRSGKVDRVLPRGLNSCIHQTLAELIRNNTPGGHLCLATSPDYTMAFLQLAFAEKLLHIDEALVIVRGYKYSTGRNFKQKRGSATKMIQEVGGESLLYDRVPVKTPVISNTLYNDYERIRTLVKGRLLKHPLNMCNYFFQCYQDIRESKMLGVDMSTEEAEWKRALSEQDKSIQDALLVIVNLFDGKEAELLHERKRAETIKPKLKERDEKIRKLNEEIQARETKIQQQTKRAKMFKAKIQKRDEKIKKLNNEIQRHKKTD